MTMVTQKTVFSMDCSFYNLTAVTGAQKASCITGSWSGKSLPTVFPMEYWFPNSLAVVCW